jgi:hypothetical protein
MIALRRLVETSLCGGHGVVRRKKGSDQNGRLWNKSRLRNGEHPARVYPLLLPRGVSKMTRHDQELLDKELWGVSSRSPQSGIIVLMIIAVFLIGFGAGGILSKTMQANTHYAALISFPNGQE